MCRSRRELSNEYLLAKIGVDTAENEPCKVCPLSVYRSPRYFKTESKALSTADPEPAPMLRLAMRLCWRGELRVLGELETHWDKWSEHRLEGFARDGAAVSAAVALRTPVNNIEYFPPNFEGLVLGCIDADFCK